MEVETNITSQVINNNASVNMLNQTWLRRMGDGHICRAPQTREQEI